jgi:hypothetical protein
MNFLWSVLTLRANRRASESLISNKRPPSADVPPDSLPRCQVVLRGCSKRVTDSEQTGLTLRTDWRIIQRLITVANVPMRRPLENLPAVQADERCCQLLLHARNSAEHLSELGTMKGSDPSILTMPRNLFKYSGLTASRLWLGHTAFSSRVTPECGDHKNNYDEQP